MSSSTIPFTAGDVGTAPAPPKAGPATTEWWTTVATNVVSLGVAVASLFGQVVDPGPLQALIPSIAILAATLTTIAYSHSRSVVKSASAEAAGVYAAARVAPPVVAGALSASANGHRPGSSGSGNGQRLNYSPASRRAV